MSARMPRLTYCEAYRLALRGNMIVRVSGIWRHSDEYRFRAHVMPRVQPLSSFEITMKITPREYKDAELPPCFASNAFFHTTIREES